VQTLHKNIKNVITSWLLQTSVPWFALYAMSAAFLTYFSMYAFRKPFTVGQYEGISWLEIDYKVVLILSQVIGYMFAKFIGIKVISEMKHNRRAVTIVAMVACAELALLLFAVVPEPIKPVAIFFNGLSLGMIWGLVFSFLEGRRTSELLGAGLSATFIIASGMVRSVGGSLLINWHVDPFWMPVLTGLIFMPLLLLSVYALSMLPEPTQEDIAARTLRVPMTSKDRWAMLSKYWFGLACMVIAFLMFTALRDFRDNFSTEIWTSLGYGSSPEIFTYAGIRIAAIVLVVMAFLILIRNNFVAFSANHLVIFIGTIVMAVSTYCFRHDLMTGKIWMIALGAGLYMAYIPFNCFLYDRMLAVTGKPGNAGFLIYISDSAGYVGSVGLLLIKYFSAPDLSWIHFLQSAVYVAALLGGALVIASWMFFNFHLKRDSAVPVAV
jgi:MFS family permease